MLYRHFFQFRILSNWLLNVVLAKSENWSGVSQHKVFNRHPGRTGVAEAGFAAFPNAVRRVADVVAVSTVDRTALAHVASWFSTAATRQIVIFVISFVSFFYHYGRIVFIPDCGLSRVDLVG